MPPTQQKRTRSRKVHIGVFTRLETYFGREVALGTQRFARNQRRWSFCTVAHVNKLTDRFVSESALDGVIIENTYPQEDVIQTIRQEKLPTVFVSRDGDRSHNYPSVQPDHGAVGLMAAKFFRSKGIQSVRFVRTKKSPPLELLTASLPATSTRTDKRLDIGEMTLPSEIPLRPPQIRTLKAKLSTLPRGTGLLAASDLVAETLISACRDARIRIPDALAILGLGNEATFSTGTITDDLSSIDLRPERIGFEAAIMIDGLTLTPPRQTSAHLAPLLVPPMHVIERATTPGTSVDDALVSDVIAYIKTHATTGLDVAQIVEHFGVNRRTLERRFRKNLHNSLHQEILSHQIRRAQELLTNSTLPISEVASEAGFSEPRLLNLAFKRQLGMTPSTFRGKSEKSRLECHT